MMKFGSVLFLFFCIGSPLFSQCTVSNNTINASPTTVCSGTTGPTINGSLFSGSEYTYSWEVSSTSATTGFTSSVSTQNLVTGTLTGNRWYRRIVTRTCTSPAGSDIDTSAVIAISVVQPPAVPTILANGPLSFCSGGSVTLTSSSATGNTWSSGQTTQSITVNQSGSYSVTVTDGNTCSSASTPKTITVFSLPVTPTINTSGPLTFCSGGSVTLTSSSATGNTWSNGQTSQFITVNQSGSYSVTVTDGNTCSSTSIPKTVNVNLAPSTPTISANGPLSFCSGGSVTLTSSSATGNTWSSGQTTQSITVNQNGSYTVSVSNGNCSSTSTPKTITVFSLPATPTINTSGPLTFCSGGSVTLTSSSATGNTWSNGQTSQFITVNQSGNYTVTVTDANTCTASSSATSVTVNPLPNTPAIPTSNSPQCSNVGVTLTRNGTPAANETWYWQTTATGTSISNSASTYSTTTVGSSTIYIRSKTAAGCWSSGAGSLSVIVNQSPQALAQATPNPVCAGSSFTLSTNSVNGSTYSWTGPNAFSSSQPSPVVLGGALSAGDYIITTTISSSNCSAKDTVSVIVNPLPVAGSFTAASTSQSVCLVSQLSSIVLQNYSGQILKWQYATNSSFSSPNDVPVTNATLNPADYSSFLGSNSTLYFRAMVVSGACTTAVTQAGVASRLLWALPTASIPGGESEAICTGDNANVRIDITGSSSPWTITFNNGSSQTINSTPYFFSVSPSANSTITIQSLTDNNGCAASTQSLTGSATITVKPRPVLQWSSQTQSICPGNTSAITGNITPNNGGSVVGSWGLPGVNLGSISTSISSNSFSIPAINISNSGSYTININTLTLDGCPSLSSYPTSSITVNQKPIVSLGSNGVVTPQDICAGIAISGNTTFQSNLLNSSFYYTWTTNSIGIPGTPVTVPNAPENLISFGTNQTSSNVPFSLFAPSNNSINAVSNDVRIYAKNGECFSDPLTYTFRVHPKPIIDALSSINPICSGESRSIPVTHNLTGSTTETIFQRFWTATTNTPGSLSNPTIGGSAFPIAFQANNNNGTSDLTLSIRAAIKSSAGCKSDTTEIGNVILRPVPRINDVTDSLLCNGDSYQYTFNGVIPAYAEIIWNQESGSSIGTLPSDSTSNPLNFTAVNSGASGTNTAIFSLQSHIIECPSNIAYSSPQTWSISVNPAPDFIFQNNNPTLDTLTELSICSGQSLPDLLLTNITGIGSVNFTSNFIIPQGISFQPSLPTGPYTISNLDFLSESVVINESDSIDGLLQLVVTANTPNVDCPKSHTLIIHVRAKPLIPSAAFPDTLIFCNALKDTIQLSSSVSNATYNYTTPNPAFLGLSSSGTTLNSIVVNPINTNSENQFRSTSLNITAINPANPLVSQSPSCQSDPFTLPIKIYANPPAPIISTNSSNLSEICQGSTNIPFEVLPASNNNFNYNYTWFNGPVELPNDSTINTTISFDNSGQQQIRVFRTNTTSGCRSSETPFDVSVSSTDISDLSNSCIFPTPSGTGLISVANDVTYLWGTIDCVSHIMNSPAANNSNQSYFPAGLPESTNDMGYWVELKRDGCRTRIFYQVGCILDYIADELNTACPNNVSIEQMEVASGISAFPNPTSNSVTFSFKSIQEVPDQMLLINAQGSKVDTLLYKVSSEYNSLTADISNLQDGLYLFILENQQGEKQAIRIIKQTN